MSFMSEALGKVRRRAALGLVVAAARGAALFGAGCGGDDQEARPQKTTSSPQTCTSPYKKSPLYPGEGDKVDPDNRKTWQKAIWISTVIPDKAKGLVVSFRSSRGEEWHTSDPVQPDDANNTIMKVGPGDVQIGTQIVAARGSKLCDQSPDSTFHQSHKPFDYLKYRLGYTDPSFP